MSWNSIVSYTIGVAPIVAATRSSRSSGTRHHGHVRLEVVNG